MIQRYAIYLAIAVIAALVGAFLMNTYSGSAIAELKAEIASERKIAQDAIDGYHSQIDTLEGLVKSAQDRGYLYEKEIANIIKTRNVLKKIDSSFNIIISTDSLTEELRKIYN